MLACGALAEESERPDDTADDPHPRDRKPRLPRLVVFEYANREMAEIEDCKEIGVDREVACGVVDVKSFYLESPEDVAERLEQCARLVPLERLSAVPDCGFFPVPRWLAFEQLKRLVAGTRLARQRLGVGD